MKRLEYYRSIDYNPHPTDSETQGFVAALCLAAGPVVLIVTVVLAFLSITI